MLNSPGNNLGKGEVRSSTLRGSTIFLHEINVLRNQHLSAFFSGQHIDVISSPYPPLNDRTEVPANPGASKPALQSLVDAH